MEKGFIANIMEMLGFTATPWLRIALTVGIMFAICALIQGVLVIGVWGAVKRFNQRHKRRWLALLIESNVFDRFMLMAQGVVVSVQTKLWLPPDTRVYDFLIFCTTLWITVLLMFTVFAIVNLSGKLAMGTHFAHKLPVNGIVQAVKLAISIVFGILIVSILMGSSPALILSGLGAMTAVLMLVFQDSIRGFAAGLQLSAYDMLALGDWLEMPKYNADGDVVEIGLTTVKVQNWDKTIVTIPTYALVSDSFKNWRGMEQAGGRRIKRSVNIDIESIHFLSEAEIAHLKKAQLLSGYLDEKVKELGAYNSELGADMENPVNGRRLTNVGTFRAYLEQYVRRHPKVHKGLTIMVRQLAPTAEGLPIEIYVFTSTTAWAEYEGIQSDIFDHIFAVLPEFNLRAYQSPTGYDLRSIAARGRENA